LLSTKNAALRYKCYETFSRNKTRAIKLTGAKARNRNYKKALIIECAHPNQEDERDAEVLKKYVLKRKKTGG
jgi:aspartate 1-decarboxylase